MVKEGGGGWGGKEVGLNRVGFFWRMKWDIHGHLLYKGFDNLIRHVRSIAFG